ncbi:THAP domain-containing protein 2 [Nasonia vitripennis]|uniref:THAP-type domain-containing protein n=1 Tax=Nasonia vitripennis TaxID=7425 RepID=A0A7M7GFU3_NASVI|nr:THAP domain-containing protein 2 [Nasonia vitripennis]
MPVNCCIPRCKSSREVHLPDFKISFHKLPSRIEDKQQWVEIIKKKCNYEVKKTSYVCSLHFQSDCFQYGGLCVNRMLKKGSVPSIFFSDVKISNEKKIENKKKLDVNNINFNNMISSPEEKLQRVPTELSVQNTTSNKRVVKCHSDKGTQTEECKVNLHDKPTTLINMSRNSRMHLINIDLAQVECSVQVRNLLHRAKKEIIDSRRRIRTLQMNKYRLLKRVNSFKLLLKNSRRQASMTTAASSALDHCYSSKRKD